MLGKKNVWPVVKGRERAPNAVADHKLFARQQAREKHADHANDVTGGSCGPLLTSRRDEENGRVGEDGDITAPANAPSPPRP